MLFMALLTLMVNIINSLWLPKQIKKQKYFSLLTSILADLYSLFIHIVLMNFSTEFL